MGAEPIRSRLFSTGYHIAITCEATTHDTKMAEAKWTQWHPQLPPILLLKNQATRRRVFSNAETLRGYVECPECPSS